jgi:HD-like signal output (HDOD) protein
MATSMAMMGSLLGSSPLSRRLQALAQLAANVAGLLANASGKADKAVAFLAGLLGEIGAMACLSVDHPYAVLMRRTDGDPAAREAEEVARYGLPSRLIGAELLRRNALPEPVCAAVEGGWDQRGQYAPALTRIAVFSRRIAPTLARAVELDALDSIAPAVAAAAVETEIVELSPDRLASLCGWAAASATHAVRSP